MAQHMCSVVEDGDQCPNEARYANPERLCPKHYQRWKRLGRADARVQVQVRGRSQEERRERKRAQARKEYARNPESFRTRQRRYEAAHPEMVRRRKDRTRTRRRPQPRIPRGRDLAKRRISKRRWEVANREYLNERSRQWARSNPEKLKASKKRWIERNPEHFAEINRAKQRRRKARLREVETVPYRECDIYERDHWICQLCRKKVDKRLRYPDRQCATIDHVVPITLGGADAPANVQLAHFSCNSSKRIRAMGEQLRLLG